MAGSLGPRGVAAGSSIASFSNANFIGMPIPTVVGRRQ